MRRATKKIETQRHRAIASNYGHTGRVTGVPLPTKDGGTLRTVLDARAYMLGLSKDRERRTQWQHAAELLLAQADVADFSKQVELALIAGRASNGRGRDGGVR